MSRIVGVSFAVGVLLAACVAPDGSTPNDGTEPDDPLASGAAANTGGSKATTGGTGATTGSGGTSRGSGGSSSASGGTDNGSGGTAGDSGGTSTGGSDPGAPVVNVFEHCNYDGWAVDLPVGDYTTEDLVELGARDDQVSSLQVSPGYEVVLYDDDNFTGPSVIITEDTSCTTGVNFNDLTSSIRVRAAGDGSGGTGGSGSGGTGGSGGSNTGGSSGGIGGVGPTTCQPAFETACKPKIVFNNQQANGGGALFNEIFPDPVATMQDITCTVCSILYRSPDEIPGNRRHTTVNLTIDNHDGVAYASGNSITMSARHLQNYTNRDRARTEYKGVMVHETVHLYQNYGNGGTGEGMADCVRIRVGLYEQGRCGRGGSWRDAYTTSGCFYSWLTGPSVYHSNGYPSNDPNLPYKLNAALAGTNGEGAYTAVSNLLQSTFGKNVDTLWNEYQNDL